jgi:DNA-directed RNA polymerase subunit RPC12/RpoP
MVHPESKVMMVQSRSKSSGRVSACRECGSKHIVIPTQSERGGATESVGRCHECGHEVVFGAGVLTSVEQRTAMWNAHNDFKLLMAAQEAKIVAAQSALAQLKSRQKRKAFNKDVLR